MNLIIAKSNGITVHNVHDVSGAEEIELMFKIYLSTGDYKKQFCFAELPKVMPGVYTIVASTFETQQVGEFFLQVGAFHPISVSKL